MGPRKLGLSAIDKPDIWSRWKAGQTLHEIGRAYGKCHNTIRAVLLPRGGIPPVARRRSRLALTFAERENISRGMASGSSIREIASCLQRTASTVSREIARHGGRATYRAYDADQQAWNAALRPKRCLLSVNSELRDMVASKLILDWSPEQISGWLKTLYPNNEGYSTTIGKYKIPVPDHWLVRTENSTNLGLMNFAPIRYPRDGKFRVPTMINVDVYLQQRGDRATGTGTDLSG